MSIPAKTIDAANDNLKLVNIPVITSQDFDTLVYDVFGVPFIMQNENEKYGVTLDAGDALVIDLTLGLSDSENKNGGKTFVRWMKKKGDYKMYSKAWHKVARFSPDNRFMSSLLIHKGINLPLKFIIEVSA